MALVNYSGDENSDGEDGDGATGILVAKRAPTFDAGLDLALPAVDACPLVPVPKDDSKWSAIDPWAKEIVHNPKYEDLYAPVAGPSNPFRTKMQASMKNTVTGYVEQAHFNPFHFESERKTFETFGYARDPSERATAVKGERYVGDKQGAVTSKGATVFESKKTGKEKRKMDTNWQSEDVDNYTGPWAKYVDEELVSKPDDQTLQEMEAYKLKRKKYTKTAKNDETDEKTILHIKDAVDYQGRTFMDVPRDVGTNLRDNFVPEKCFMPKKLVHTYVGHQKGVQAIRWFPGSAHLILSAGMDNKVKLWEVYHKRPCIRTYAGHRMAVRDVNFNADGTQFVTASFDRYIKLWDTETGQCKQRFSSGKTPYCCVFNPDADKQNCFVTGMQDKKILQWDTRTAEIVQEYDRHLGAVNSIQFFDNNRRFCSTSDDKSLRVWEWGIPVDTKLIQDHKLHSMPYTRVSPDKKWLLGQSMDNRIVMFQIDGEKLRFSKKKALRGHMTAGYACGFDFSPDMGMVASGDSGGKVYAWEWLTHRMVARWKAHDRACMGLLWHPHEVSLVATCGWDNMIKLWN